MPASRIAALSCEVAEVALALAADRLLIVPERKLLGVASNHVAAALGVPHALPLLPRLDLDVGAILALAPDLVLATVWRPQQAEALQQLAAAGLPVVVCRGRWAAFDEIARHVSAIGAALDEPAAAARLVHQMDGTVGRGRAIAGRHDARPSVACLAHNGVRLTVSRPGNMPHDLVALAGGTPLAPADPGADPLAWLATARPDRLLLVDGSGEGVAPFAAGLAAADATIPARVFLLRQVYPDAAHYLADGLLAVAEWLQT